MKLLRLLSATSQVSHDSYSVFFEGFLTEESRFKVRLSRRLPNMAVFGTQLDSRALNKKSGRTKNKRQKEIKRIRKGIIFQKYVASKTFNKECIAGIFFVLNREEVSNR